MVRHEPPTEISRIRQGFYGGNGLRHRRHVELLAGCGRTRRNQYEDEQKRADHLQPIDDPDPGFVGPVRTGPHLPGHGSELYLWNYR
jgi:hypothetical protein